MRSGSQLPATSLSKIAADAAAKNASAGSCSAGNRQYVSLSSTLTALPALISTPSTVTGPATASMWERATGSSEITPSTACPLVAATSPWNRLAVVGKFGVLV